MSNLNPPAGFVNDQILPTPPKPSVAGQPAPQPPAPMSKPSKPGVAPKEVKAYVTHVLLSAGWIPVDRDTLSISHETLFGHDPKSTLSFMSEGGKKQITCRIGSIQATKVAYG